jgi:hypothetical protein
MPPPSRKRDGIDGGAALKRPPLQVPRSQEEEMADKCILVEKAEGVAILTMNRPEQLNAMSHELSTELHDAVTRMGADDEVGCIVITGLGTVPSPPAETFTSNATTTGGIRRRSWTPATPFALAGATRSAPAPSRPSG